MRPRAWLRYVGYFLGFLVLAMSFWLPVTAFQTGEGVSTALWILGIDLYFAFYFFWFVPFQARRMYRQRAAKGEPIHLEADGEGFGIESSRGNAKSPWTDFRRWRENKRIFLLFLADDLTFIVPKRHLERNAGAELRCILEQHVGPAS